MSWQRAQPRERSANIFINYRREDSAGHAGRLFDALSDHFQGRLFMDVDTLEPGVDFVEAIEKAVGSCEVLIVVIGREWLTIEDKAGNRRLDNPGDFVRLEVESALNRRIRVIPVLVQDAPMPRAEELPESISRLARRNAIELSDARWAYDVDRLIHTIQDVLEEKKPDSGPSPAPVAPAADKAPGGRIWLSLAALGLVTAVLLVSWLWLRRTPSGNATPPQVQTVRMETVAVPAGNEAPAPDRAPSRKLLRAEPVPKVESPSPTPDRVEEEPSAPAPSVQPARTKILSPQSGETVGSDVLVQGVVFGLDESQQIFLGIRQKNGAVYPRGELFPNADGQWSIKLRSSKEKTFDVLVVTSVNKEATQILRDQRSRDDGLPTLPDGASISSSSVVTLKRQGKLGSILNPRKGQPGR
ncbi:MAG TPA: TIR domain-containing protein [Thermoanaerobaculia bacterium]|nr:TIR domain-containing protein [Thermoanaerobaculia bacterium]